MWSGRRQWSGRRCLRTTGFEPATLTLAIWLEIRTPPLSRAFAALEGADTAPAGPCGAQSVGRMLAGSSRDSRGCS